MLMVFKFTRGIVLALTFLSLPMWCTAQNINYGFQVGLNASCCIESYNMTFVPKEEDPVEVINRSPTYSEKSKELLEKVKAGDIIYFDNVKCKCSGDAAARAINSMVFKIK